MERRTTGMITRLVMKISLEDELSSAVNNDTFLAVGLPKVTGPIDADRFAMARISEINDMQSAIKKARFLFL